MYKSIDISPNNRKEIGLYGRSLVSNNNNNKKKR